MDIYVVQPGDDINSIANRYGVSAGKLIEDNGLMNQDSLVIGQSIVITYPDVVHTVAEGDTLDSIASEYNITLMQLLGNNPYLSERDYIYPGETITISYPTIRSIITNGYAYPYIKRETLTKTFPNLTYISIFNYRATGAGEITAFYDDTEMIELAKSYGVAPLLMISTLSPSGEPNIETAYGILLSEEYQERHINNIINILKSKGYHGVNVTINYMNMINQKLYERFIEKISSRVRGEGFQFFVTFNFIITETDEQITFDRIDYSNISGLIDNATFLQFIWGTNYGPPAPVSSIRNLRAYAEYVVTMVPPNKVVLGEPLISYDWELPYIQGRSSANALTIDAALRMADVTGETIRFDEISATLYFNYKWVNYGSTEQHIVWTVDARSIDALNNLIDELDIAGTGVWNIMVYSTQLWSVIRSRYDVIKVLPV